MPFLAGRPVMVLLRCFLELCTVAHVGQPPVSAAERRCSSIFRGRVVVAPRWIAARYSDLRAFRSRCRSKHSSRCDPPLLKFAATATGALLAAQMSFTAARSALSSLAQPAVSIDTLRTQLKAWERGFVDAKGRAPGPDDLTPEVRALHAQYKALKAAAPPPAPAVAKRPAAELGEAAKPPPAKRTSSLLRGLALGKRPAAPEAAAAAPAAPLPPPTDALPPSMPTRPPPAAAPARPQPHRAAAARTGRHHPRRPAGAARQPVRRARRAVCAAGHRRAGQTAADAAHAAGHRRAREQRGGAAVAVGRRRGQRRRSSAAARARRGGGARAGGGAGGGADPVLRGDGVLVRRAGPALRDGVGQEVRIRGRSRQAGR